MSKVLRDGTFEKPKIPAWVPEVIPMLEVPTLTDLKMTLFGSDLLNFDPNCSKLMENLENTPWKGSLLR
jgi:hypothetical protein